MDIAVLDYTTGRVTIYQQVEIDGDTELIEGFLSEKGHNLDNIHYMTGTQLQVDFETA